jgi:hypothetical protein
MTSMMISSVLLFRGGGGRRVADTWQVIPVGVLWAISLPNRPGHEFLGRHYERCRTAG